VPGAARTKPESKPLLTGVEVVTHRAIERDAAREWSGRHSCAVATWSTAPGPWTTRPVDVTGEPQQPVPPPVGGGDASMGVVVV